MQLGRYQILKQLASGSVADVLLARATGLEGFARHVVIKRIRPEHGTHPRFVQAFLEEARIAASLHHQNIVQVHDIGEQDGSYFFAMEYVHGEDVRRLLARARERGTQVPLDHVIAITCATAAGLHHAHTQITPDGQPLGLVHRDVSPANILIGYDGSVKLVDFGLAKAMLRSTTTATGVLKGKASYMSPEQCCGRPIDRRTDTFALGIVLFELATARRLFKGATEFYTMAAVVEGEIPKPSSIRPDIPPALDTLILRALTRDPDGRFQTAEDMRAALEQFGIEHELRTSNKALADYLTSLFGARGEPWHDDSLPQPAISPDFDLTNGAGIVSTPSDDNSKLLERHAPGRQSPIRFAQALADGTDVEDDALEEEPATLVAVDVVAKPPPPPRRKSAPVIEPPSAPPPATEPAAAGPRAAELVNPADVPASISVTTLQALSAETQPTTSSTTLQALSADTQPTAGDVLQTASSPTVPPAGAASMRLPLATEPSGNPTVEQALSAETESLSGTMLQALTVETSPTMNPASLRGADVFAVETNPTVVPLGGPGGKADAAPNSGLSATPPKRPGSPPPSPPAKSVSSLASDQPVQSGTAPSSTAGTPSATTRPDSPSSAPPTASTSSGSGPASPSPVSPSSGSPSSSSSPPAPTASSSLSPLAFTARLQSGGAAQGPAPKPLPSLTSVVTGTRSPALSQEAPMPRPPVVPAATPAPGAPVAEAKGEADFPDEEMPTTVGTNEEKLVLGVRKPDEEPTARRTSDHAAARPSAQLPAQRSTEMPTVLRNYDPAARRSAQLAAQSDPTSQPRAESDDDYSATVVTPPLFADGTEDSQIRPPIDPASYPPLEASPRSAPASSFGPSIGPAFGPASGPSFGPPPGTVIGAPTDPSNASSVAPFHVGPPALPSGSSKLARYTAATKQWLARTVDAAKAALAAPNKRARARKFLTKHRTSITVGSLAGLAVVLLAVLTMRAC